MAGRPAPFVLRGVPAPAAAAPVGAPPAAPAAAPAGPPPAALPPDLVAALANPSAANRDIRMAEANRLAGPLVVAQGYISEKPEFDSLLPLFNCYEKEVEVPAARAARAAPPAPAPPPAAPPAPAAAPAPLARAASAPGAPAPRRRARSVAAAP